MRHLSLLLFVVMVPLLSGCHCCQVTEKYADCIDDVSDCNICLDKCYCERLDLTRLCMNRRCPNCGR